MPYVRLLVALGIDAASIGTLAYVVYFRRHRRADLLLAYVALNAGVLAAVILLTTERIGLALGFGLFGILSIVRLRSSTITQGEVGYYFIALTMGLVNGLWPGRLPISVTLDAVLIGVMFLLDRPRIGAGTTRSCVVLDVVHADMSTLRADLENRLGAHVVSCTVTEIDYVRDVTVCDVLVRDAGRSGKSLTAVGR